MVALPGHHFIVTFLKDGESIWIKGTLVERYGNAIRVKEGESRILRYEMEGEKVSIYMFFQSLPGDNPFGIDDFDERDRYTEYFL